MCNLKCVSFCVLTGYARTVTKYEISVGIPRLFTDFVSRLTKTFDTVSPGVCQPNLLSPIFGTLTATGEPRNQVTASSFESCLQPSFS
jgi:hypothetical protein